MPKTTQEQISTDTFFGQLDVEFLVHELKDPIAVIETAVRMLLEKKERYGPLTARQHKTLLRALRNSRKARGLLADLLEVGRSDAGCIQCCRFSGFEVVVQVLGEAIESVDMDLCEAVAQADGLEKRLALMAGHGIAVGCQDAARHLQLCQDEAKFRQIVGNLVKNGLHHRKHQLTVSMEKRGRQLSLAVADDGPGVPKEDRELIFERYARLAECTILSRTGHGLGLAGARVLARRLGGDIVIDDLGRPGATFRLTLPLDAHELPDGRASSEKNA